MALSQFQYTLVILLIIAVIAIAAVMMFFISRKYPKKGGKADPVQKAVIVWLILLLGYLMFAALGYRTQEEVRKDIKWWFLSALALIVFYAFVSYFLKRPIKSIVLWRKYVLPDVRAYWNAEPYGGAAYARGMLFHKVIDVAGNKYFEGKENVRDTQVDIFIGQAHFSSTFTFLAVRGKVTGEDIEMAAPPILTQKMIQDLMGKDFVISLQPALAEYDTQVDTANSKGVNKGAPA